jgi:hypothetical protein
MARIDELTAAEQADFEPEQHAKNEARRPPSRSSTDRSDLIPPPLSSLRSRSRRSSAAMSLHTTDDEATQARPSVRSSVRRPSTPGADPHEIRANLIAAFGTLRQQRAHTAADINRANAAALQEALKASEQGRDFTEDAELHDAIARSLHERSASAADIKSSNAALLDDGMKASRQEPGSADVVQLHDALARSLQEKAFALLVNTRSPERREAQQAPYADRRAEFRTYLDRHGLQTVPTEGAKRDSAIRALVRQIRPELTAAELEQHIHDLREQYDGIRTHASRQKLPIDLGVDGATNTLVKLLNKRYDVSIQLGVVDAGVERDYPVTHIGVFGEHSDAPDAGFTHRLVLFEHNGERYDAITAKAVDG